MKPEIIYRADDPRIIELIEKDIPIEVLEKRMRPNRDSSWGMLGEDESLIKIIVSDNEVLQEGGVSYCAIANKIEEVFKMKKDREILDTGYLAIDYITCGTKLCPWGDGYGDNEFYIILLDLLNNDHNLFLEKWKDCGCILPDNKTFKELFKEEPVIVVSGIMPHLIRDHHFFQGKDTVYRCDPKQLINYLGIRGS